MSEETWRHVKRAALTVGYVMWTGFGETLLHPKWAAYMSELDASGIASGFSTNGTLLTEENCRVLADLTLGYHVNVSLDSLDEAIYFALRKGALHHVTAGLRNLVAQCNRERVTVASVVTRSNFASLVDVPDMLAELGIREYVLMSMQEHRSGIHPGTQLLGRAFEHTLARIEARARAAGIRLRVDVPHRLAAQTREPEMYERSYVFRDVEPPGLTRACLVPWEIPFCDKDGNVFPCSNSTGSEEYVMGNLRELPFETIWRGDRFERFRSSLASGNGIPVACRACTIQRKGVHPTVEHAAELIEIHGIKPDLVCFGKSIANGMAVSMVAGMEKAMSQFTKIWYGLTFDQESVSLAAAAATLEVVQEQNVPERIGQIGSILKAEYQSIARRLGVDSELSGPDQRPRFQFGYSREFGSDVGQFARFLAKLYEDGVIVASSSLFLSFAHDESVAERLVRSFEKAMMAAALPSAQDNFAHLPPRSGLRADLELRVLGTTIPAGGQLHASVVVTNTGKAPWLPSSATPGGVNLGAHLFDAEGVLMNFDHWRQALPPEKPQGGAQSLSSGAGAPAEATYELQVSVPVPAQAGRYRLEFDLVSEGIAWFKDNGSQTVTIVVLVV